MVNINDLTPYEYNAKLHPQSQIDQIKESIKKFGNNDPIAIDECNTIIEGHGRWIALKQMGVKEVPVIRLTNLNEEQKRAYILVHNKLTMNTGFDLIVLEEELGKIEGIDLGYFELELDTHVDAEIDVPDQESLDLVKFNLVLSEEQYQMVLNASDYIDENVSELHTFGSKNKRNNLVFEVIYQWAEQKMLLSK